MIYSRKTFIICTIIFLILFYLITYIIYFDKKYNNAYTKNKTVPYEYWDYIVTGGAGFIGHHMISFILFQEPDSKILVIDNLSRGNIHHIEHLLVNPQVKFVQVDLRDPDIVYQYISNAHTVIHLADIVAGIDYIFSHQSSVFSDNMLINIHVLGACVKNNIKKYLYVGTACSFPLNLQDAYTVTRLSENQTYPAMPESSYGWSKLMGEYEATLAINATELDIGINRLHNVYGPGMVYGEIGSQIIPSLMRKAMLCLDKNEEIEVWGSGNQYRDFVHVDDVVRGIWLTLQYGMNQGVIQLGTGIPITIRDVVKYISIIMEEIWGKECSIKWDSNKMEGDKGRVAIATRAKEILGWSPQKTFDEGIVDVMLDVFQSMTFNGMKDQQNFPVIVDLPKVFADTLVNINRSELMLNIHKSKTLVILIGQARGGENAWNSLRRNVLTPLDADLAVMFTGPSPLDSWAKYVWEIPEYADWSQGFDNMGCGSDWRQLCKLPGIAFGGINHCGDDGIGSGAILLTFRGEVLKQIISRGLHFKYDHFILSRADHVYGCLHPIPFKDDRVWIPDGEDYGGVTDRHLMASASVFMKAINASEIICNAEKWYKVLSQNQHGTNLELLLKQFYENQEISIARFPRNMFSIKQNKDPTRWSKGDIHPILTPKYNIMVKYPRELDATLHTCGKSVDDIIG